MAVDAREGTYCVYHVESNFRNFKNRRQEFAMGTGEITMGPPKKQLEMLAQKQHGTSVVRTKPRYMPSEAAEAATTPTYHFGGGETITLGTKKGAEARQTRLTDEQNDKINEEL
jgi:hypothetical protein